MGKQEGGNIAINLFAVEVRKFCPCHRLILARMNDAHEWFYFFVKEPSWIEFGDRLLYYPATRELFQDRGLTLTYRARLDDLPVEVATDLVERLPYPEMYPDDFGGNTAGIKPPQGEK